MELLLHFHVNTPHRDKLADLLQRYSGIPPVRTRRFIADVAECLLAEIEAEPDYYVINQSDPQWQSVEFNSLIKLHRLGAIVSKELQPLFVQTSYLAIKEYTYFLAYENGQMLREIESTHDSLIPVINRGNLFEFERRQNDGKADDELQMFDLDSLADYSQQLGIDLSNLFCDSSSTILKREGTRNVLYSVGREKLRLLKQIEQMVRLKKPE